MAKKAKKKVTKKKRAPEKFKAARFAKKSSKKASKKTSKRSHKKKTLAAHAKAGGTFAEWVPINSIKPWKDNPRDNEEAVEELMLTMMTYGWSGDAITVDQWGTIRAGDSRYKAAKKLKLTKVPVRRLKFRDKHHAEMFALAHNKVGERANWNEKKLAQIFERTKRVMDKDEIERLSSFRPTEIKWTPTLIIGGDEKNNSALYIAETDEWETPQDFFNRLAKEFRFTLDVCASNKNTKCKRHFTKRQDGLSKKWTGVCWMNPPYGTEINKWVRKAYQSARTGATVVCLIPARTDTRWWHNFVMRSSEIRLIEGRLRFGGSVENAPFPSAIVIFRKRNPSKPSLVSTPAHTGKKKSAKKKLSKKKRK